MVTLNDGRAYTADILDNDPTALLLALLTFIRANEESATKARRLRAAWQGKRLKAAAGIGMTAKCPAWLRLDPDTRRYEPMPEHAEVVRRIFALASQGVGLHGVAATLNRDGVPTFGSGPKKAEFWNRSYIAKIVDSPAVIGTYVPHSVDHDAGRRKRVPGEPIEGYFPAVVDPEVHARVQASRLGRRAPATRSGHAQSVSLLAGLAVCPWCGATMTRVVKGKKGGSLDHFVRSKLGACRMPSVPQHEAEDTLIYWAGTLSRVPSGGSDWDEAHMELVQKIGGYDRQIQTVADELLQGRSAALRDRLAHLESEREDAAARLREVEARALTAGPVLERSARDLHEALIAPQVNRQAVNGLLRQTFDSVTVDGEERQLRLAWKHGVNRRCHSMRFGPRPSAVPHQSRMLYSVWRELSAVTWLRLRALSNIARPLPRATPKAARARLPAAPTSPAVRPAPRPPTGARSGRGCNAGTRTPRRTTAPSCTRPTVRP